MPIHQFVKLWIWVNLNMTLKRKLISQRKKQKTVLLKEIKMRPVTETHDYDFKVKNAKKFIAKGDKVKFTS